MSSLLQSFHFDQSSDEEVLRVERAMFLCLRQEAAELQGSAAPLTSRLVQAYLLQHKTLPEALVAMLSSKLSDTHIAEEDLRSSMARVLNTPAARRAVVSDLAKVRQLGIYHP